MKYLLRFDIIWYYSILFVFIHFTNNISNIFTNTDNMSIFVFDLGSNIMANRWSLANTRRPKQLFAQAHRAAACDSNARPPHKAILITYLSIQCNAWKKLWCDYKDRAYFTELQRCTQRVSFVCCFIVLTPEHCKCVRVVSLAVRQTTRIVRFCVRFPQGVEILAGTKCCLGVVSNLKSGLEQRLTACTD